MRLVDITDYYKLKLSLEFFNDEKLKTNFVELCKLIKILKRVTKRQTYREQSDIIGLKYSIKKNRSKIRRRKRETVYVRTEFHVNTEEIYVRYRKTFSRIKS